jgi:hypothetical protein
MVGGIVSDMFPFNFWFFQGGEFVTEFKLLFFFYGASFLGEGGFGVFPSRRGPDLFSLCILGCCHPSSRSFSCWDWGIFGQFFWKCPYSWQVSAFKWKLFIV